MNAERRKELAKVRDALEEQKETLTGIAAEERDAFENLPESVQQGERGQKMEAAADVLDTAIGSIEEAISSIDEAME